MADTSFYGLLVLACNRSAPPAVLPELHLNIWEKKKNWIFEAAFLDIGLMLDVEETAETFEFVLPWSVSEQDLEDLSLRLQDAGAIPAIFNEGWVCANTNGSAGYVNGPGSEPLFTFVQLGTDLEVYTHNPNSSHAQQSIRLNVRGIQSKSKSANQAVKRMYMRFRVKNVPNHFYRVSINPRDRLLLSSWQRTEIIDFRVNVRRGIPLGFEGNRIKGNLVAFRKVHLFLMKSRDQDIVFEDERFKSCRSLDDEHFGASYSLAANPSDWHKFWSRLRVKNSLGYQWTKKIEKDPITNADLPVIEFGTLARFKKVRFGITKFIIAAGIVGALGNMVWDGVKFRYEGAPIAAKVKAWIARTSDAGERK
jgi:hypothetical protein